MQFVLITYFKYVKPKAGEYYNIGGKHTVKISRLLDDLIGLSKLKKQLNIVVDKDRLRPIDADLQVPDTSKFSKHTGWKPEISYTQTLIGLIGILAYYGQIKR